MPTDLELAFDLVNLKRAWLWIGTNSEFRFKNYFRHIYRSYSLSPNKNLIDLQNRLATKTYKEIHATKIYLPKKSGVLRPYTLLTIEDQIVYQSLINIVAEKLSPRVRRRYGKSVFGHLYAGKRSLFFIKTGGLATGRSQNQLGRHLRTALSTPRLSI